MNAKVIAVWARTEAARPQQRLILRFRFHSVISRWDSFLQIYITEKCRCFAAVMSLTTEEYITRLWRRNKEYACAGRKNISICAVCSR